MQQLKGWNIFLDRGAPTPFYQQPSHRFTDMGCEQKMMANGKNSLLRADAGVRLNNLMKPNSSHISLRTWSAKEGNTHVKNGLLHEYLARRCTGVECFAQEAQSTTVCNNSRDGTSSCTEAAAPFSYEQPSHRFTDMGCEHKMMANAKNCLLHADAGVRLNNLMKPNNSHISLRTWSARKGNTHVKNGLLHEYLARRCTGVEYFAQEAQSTTVCNNS